MGKKALNTKFFGMNNTTELVEMIKDTASISEDDRILNTVLTEDVEKSFNIFVKFTEECRRERQRRIDAGDETAKLRFSVLAASACCEGFTWLILSGKVWIPRKSELANWPKVAAASSIVLGRLPAFGSAVLEAELSRREALVMRLWRPATMIPG